MRADLVTLEIAPHRGRTRYHSCLLVLQEGRAGQDQEPPGRQRFQWSDNNRIVEIKSPLILPFTDGLDAIAAALPPLQEVAGYPYAGLDDSAVGNDT